MEKTKRENSEILFDGHFYDVTEFLKRHPGGSIIKYYTQKGEDATHAIQQFHQRSTKRVSSIMSTLKKRKASDNEIGLDAGVLKKNRALTEDFTKLYIDLEREGYFEPSYTHIVFRFVELIFIAAVACFLLAQQHIFARFIGGVILGIMCGRFGWIQHESGHHSLTGIPKLDRILHAITIGFGLGGSSTWWARGHNRHHAMPQRLNHDVDLDTMPIVAYNTKVVKNPEDGKGFMVQNQAYLFVLIDTLIVAVVWKMYLHPKFAFKHKLYLEMAAMLTHFWMLYLLGFWMSLLSTWVASMYLFVNFALNHTFLPVTSEPTHWVEYSLLHTADVDQSAWCDWWMGYLNYQIEHHLFPTMPQFRHPLIKDRVKALAEKHNIPYIVNSYPEALRVTLKNFADVSKELKSAD